MHVPEEAEVDSGHKKEGKSKVKSQKAKVKSAAGTGAAQISGSVHRSNRKTFDFCLLTFDF
jgi:hypothetical protein